MFRLRKYTKQHSKNEKCENDTCLDCLIEELKKENWHNSSEDVLLKIAYEKKIIQNIVTSISDLNKEDKKKLEQILSLYYIDLYCL